jgi:putative transposase
VIPFFAFPEGVRRIIYTTTAIEALNSKIRRAVRTRGHFPGDDAATKLLYLVLNHAADEWKRPQRLGIISKGQFSAPKIVPERERGPSGPRECIM